VCVVFREKGHGGDAAALARRLFAAFAETRDPRLASAQAGQR
jgi:hypothetical protein